MLDRKSKKIVILPPLSSNLKTGTTFSVTGSEKTLDAHKIDGIGTIVNDSLLNFSFTDSIARTIINLTLPPANDTVNVKLVKRYNVSMTR